MKNLLSKDVTTEGIPGEDFCGVCEKCTRAK